MSNDKNTTNTVTYDAFISYRHTEPDMFVAKQLHREMEAFRLPHSVIKKIGDSKKTRINRVFRDQDELPLASNLEEPIKIALAASDFLIVICSPRLPLSEWCKKEIETFIEIKGREHILAVLIEGEPQDSFPELLCFREEEQVQADGSVQTVKIPIEPLAADVRGKNRQEVKRKIKEEIIRLAAPMFGCAYDDLKQRHRERKIKRILTIAGLGSAVCLLFGAVSTMMALRIQKQNQEISRQSEQIVAQNDEIQQQYQSAMITNAELTATGALSMLAEGDRVEAVRSVRSVLPDTKTDADMPYVASAEYALSESLQVYADGSLIEPRLNMKHDSNLSFMTPSPDRMKLLTVDDSSMVTIWDTESGKKILRIEDYVQKTLLEDTNIVFLDNNRVACLSHNEEENCKEIAIFSLTDGAKESFNTDDAGSLYSDGEGSLVILGSENVYFWKDGQFQGEFSDSEAYTNIMYASAFNEDKSLFAFAQYANEDNQANRVVVLDTNSGEMVHCYPMTYHSFEKMRFMGDVLYVINNKGYDDFDIDYSNQNLLDLEYNGLLIACDLQSYEGILWTYDNAGVSLKDAIRLGSGESNILVANGASTIVLINSLDGTMVASYDFGVAIADVITYSSSEWITIYLRQGEFYLARLSDGVLNVTKSNQKLDVCKSGIMQLTICNNMIILLPNAGVNVTEVAYLQGPQVEEFMECGTTLKQPELNGNNEQVLFSSYWNYEYHVMDAESGEIQFTITPDIENTSDSGFVGESDDTIAILAYKKAYLYSSEDGALQKEYEVETGPTSYTLEGKDRQFILCTDKELLRIYNTMTGELLHEVVPDGIVKRTDSVDLDASGTRLAVTIAADKSLTIYDVETGNKKTELEMNASFVSDLFFYPEKKEDGSTKLFVVYKDRSMELYELSAEDVLTLTHTYEPFSYLPESVIAGPNDTYVLICAEAGYYMQQDELTACIPNLKIANWEKNEFLAGNGEILYKMPIYSYEMLLEEADSYLEQR